MKGRGVGESTPLLRRDSSHGELIPFKLFAAVQRINESIFYG